MTAEERVSEFLNGLGALAETMKAAYDKFVSVGFKEEQALYLCGQLLQTLGRFKGDKP